MYMVELQPSKALKCIKLLEDLMMMFVCFSQVIVRINFDSMSCDVGIAHY